MKSYRNAVILVVVLGLLFGAYMYISKKKGPDTNSTTDSSIKVLDLDKDKITEIEIDNKGERLVFDKGSGDWALTIPAGIKYDKSKLGDIASGIATITADKLIEENATDLDQYGLKTPITVSVKLSDGTVKNLELGSKTPTGDDYYVKLSDSNKVYTIASYTAESFIITKNDIRDKTLFTMKKEEISGFEMDKTGTLMFATQKISDTNWALTEPFDATADDSKLDPIFQAVIGLNVKNYVEDNAPDLSKYGLQTPAYAFDVETTGGSTKIFLGDEKVKDSERYAMLENSNDVFTVDESGLNFLDEPLKEMLDPFAYLANIDDVKNVSLEMDGSTDNIDVQTSPDKNKDNDKFVVNGKDLKDVKVGDKTGADLFRTFYQGMIGITLSDLDPTAKPSGTPEITFTYTLKAAPNTMKVEFIPKDNDYYYVVKNGKYSNILVEKSEFTSLRDGRKALLDAISKK